MATVMDWRVAQSNRKLIAKRVFDLIFASLALIIFAPVFIVVAILIKLDSPGPVFFKGERIGRDGIPFHILKFRSMVPDAPSKGAAITCQDDPRITRLGRILREAKLDELPSLINVLRGEMSFVGPRPEARVWVERYTSGQRAVLSVKPGITGPSQVRYRHEESLLSSDGLETEYFNIMNDKLTIDLDYIEDQSFLEDLRILLKTAAALIRATT